MSSSVRPKITITLPEGIYRSVKIDLKNIDGYVPGKTDIRVNVPLRTTIYGTVEQRNCIDMTDTVAGDAVFLHNDGRLYSGDYSEVFLAHIGAEVMSTKDLNHEWIEP